MLKNKDDEFLGDSITNNVKYADNEWQAQGTIDRGSVYTKEPLLDLLFEGFDYSKLIGDYSQYVARASTEIASGSTNPYVAAKLQHDLYVLDMQYYSASATSSVNNIFSLDTFLEKATSIANPVFDSKAVVKEINLFGITKNANNKLVWTNPALKTVKLFDILKYLHPNYHYSVSLNATELARDFVKFINRYRSTTTVKNGDTIVLEYFNTGYPSTAPEAYVAKLFDATELAEISQVAAIVNGTFGDFIEGLHTKGWRNPSNPAKPDESLAEAFIRDFTIRLHNPDSIKMPFYNRGTSKNTTTDETFKEKEDVRTFKTRFIANSLSRNLIVSGSSLSKPIYMEDLTEILEDAIFGPSVTDVDDSSLSYDSRTELSTNVQTSRILKKELLSATGKYSHLYNQKDTAEVTLMSDYIKVIDSMDTSISLYCPDIYTGYSSTSTPEKSWGIHFLNEESTENLFQDTDNTYKLYNNVIIGYRLADTMIAQKTGMAGIYYLIQERSSQETIPTTVDIPLSKFTGFGNFFDCVAMENDIGLTYYPTLTAINVFYKLGHETTTVEIPEKERDANYSYVFADEIKEWLSQECFIFKGNVYGDYVEELNFLQDLTPDSDVHFNNIRAKKTEIRHKRYQDSNYEVPYVERTAPLLNPNPENVEGLDVHGSDAIAGTGNIRSPEGAAGASQNILPPFIYDYDKTDQSGWMDKNVDPRVKNISGNAQTVSSPNSKGIVVAEDSIKSPTIDALWTFLKYLTESDGAFVDQGYNERLPKFYGIERSYIEDTLFDKDTNKLNRNTVNPRATENVRAIDILNWKPLKTEEKNLHYSPDSGEHVECQFGGYQVTGYIEKIYDYEVKPFSRRATALDDDLYEYNTEKSGDFNNVTGYLEKLYNSAILAFDLPDVSDQDKIKSVANVYLLSMNALDRVSGTGDTNVFTTENDAKLLTTSKPVHSTVQRQAALIDIANILNYHAADGNGATASKHNHYKKYLENPKNLKEIERDLETLRQNLQTLAEFSIASYVNLGYADRAYNRGTLHQLHKNAYNFAATLITDVNNTLAVGDDVFLSDLTTELNNIVDSLIVVDMDRRVVFDDGDYTNRYLRENYDARVVDLNSNVTEHSRAKHAMYRPNETLLSEVYLAADGTWRSIHEHTILPVIYSAH